MGKRITPRLIFAIVSTLVVEVALVVIVLWGLPRFGIYIPLWGLILLMVTWIVYAISVYRMGSRALRKKPVLTGMVGSKGKVMNPLAPDGFVRISGELWQVTSVDKDIGVGDEVTVVRQDGLKLIVTKSTGSDLTEGK